MIKTLLMISFFTLVGQNLSYAMPQARYLYQYENHEVDLNSLKVIQTEVIDNLWAVELLLYDHPNPNIYYMIRVRPHKIAGMPIPRFTNEYNQIHFTFFDGLGGSDEILLQHFAVNKLLYFGEEFTNYYQGNYIHEIPFTDFKGIRMIVQNLKISCDVNNQIQSLTAK